MADQPSEATASSANNLGSALGKLLGGGNRPAPNPGANHRPIVKALEDIGMKANLMRLKVDGMLADCIVIPAEELMRKEYEYITGVKFNYLTEFDHNQVEEYNDEHPDKPWEPPTK